MRPSGAVRKLILGSGYTALAAATVAFAARAAAQATAEGVAAVTRAVRTRQPLVIDGRDDDPVWKTIQPTSGFRQYFPREDGEPTVRTEFKVAYDDHNLYVFIRAFDPHPDSIMHALTRRDVSSASDAIGITIDGYHDRRTGVEFVVNPDGVKKDCAVYADTLYDWSWDGVWDVAARVDSLGWTAEFRIPFSQFRYADEPAHTFGFAVWRSSYRYYESSIWPLWRISRGGLMSQLGQLVGVDGIASPHALVVAPYVAATSTSRRTGTGYDRAQLATAGSDVKYRVGPNLSLDATVRPDFGQVEADPSVLNLTTAETFYPEKRPFFLEGSRLYQFDLGCTVASCANEGLFYSRRIGRAPQLAAVYGDASSPAATPIAAAAKLTGRTDRGLTVAMLDALTERVGGGANQAIEPGTNYAVVRAVQEAFGGQSAFGVMATGVNRVLDASTAGLLRRHAYVGAVDFRQRFGGGPFGVSASLTGSHVDGSAAAIAATQLSSAHYYQRPDGALRFDSTRTSLSGSAQEITIGKYGGMVQFLTQWQRHSAGLEVNDVGYMQRSDLQSLATGATVSVLTPHWMYRQLRLSANWSKSWNNEWLQLGHGVSAQAHVLFTTNWALDGALNVSQLGATFCDRCARGGPALRQDPGMSALLSITADPRRVAVPGIGLNVARGDAGRTHTVTVNPTLTLNLSTRLQAAVGGGLQLGHDNTQWYGNFTDSSRAVHYAFALLEQRTLSVTMRASYAATPNLTFELYAAPFVSTGTYSNTRELSPMPRAPSYDARFTPYIPPPGNADGFDVRQLRSNLVARWEYLPGSTLFVVWTHGRDGSDGASGDRSWRAEYGRLFALHPDNTFVAKVSYWLGR
jgi:hypothetical protein